MKDKRDYLSTSLEHAIAKTLENMTFEEVIIIDNDDVVRRVPKSDLLWARLPVHEPYKGFLALEVPAEYGRLIAEEVYGEVQTEISEALILDALAEISNTIAGRFLDELVPSDRAFVLGLPETGKGEVPGAVKRVRSIQMNVGQHYLTAFVVGDDFEKVKSINS
jgi:hypothetical protein